MVWPTLGWGTEQNIVELVDCDRLAQSAGGLTIGADGWLPGWEKGKVFPYSLPSVGPGADPGVQAVSLQVT